MTPVPWLDARWMSNEDLPAYANHNARIRYEAHRAEIYSTLIVAIERAGEGFAEMGLDVDDAAGWIESAMEMADWPAYFDDEVYA